MFILKSNTDQQALPTFIASASTQNTSNGTTLEINKPTGTVENDLMVSFVFSSAAVTWTGDTGWTEIFDHGISNSLRVAYKVAGAGEGSSYTFTASSSTGTKGGSILTYRYCTYDSIGSVTTAADPLVITAVTASVVNCLLVGVACRAVSSLTITAPGSMTTRVTNNDAQGASWCIADEQLTSSGSSGTRTFSGFGSTSTVAGILLTLKPN